MPETTPRLRPDDVQEYRFTVVKGARPGAVVTFAGGIRSVSVGRAVDNEVVVNDPSVSRKHVRVDLTAEGWSIVDLGSAAGTEKMGFRLGEGPEPLQSGDEFRMGDTILRFEVVAKKGALKRLKDEEEQKAKGPAKPSALQGLLGNRRVVLLAGTAIVILLGLLLWPTAPGFPAQSTGVLSPDVNTIVGFVPEDRRHLDGATISVPADVPGLSIYFQLRNAKEVELRAGTRPVTTFEPSTTYRAHVLLGIPRAFAGDEGARLFFDNLGWEPADGEIDPAQAAEWGLRRFRVARAAETTASPAQIDEELVALSALAGRVGGTVGARYALMKGLHAIAFRLMKTSGRALLLVDIPAPDAVGEADLGVMLQSARGELARENPGEALKSVSRAIGQVEGELSRESRRLTNALGLARSATRKAEEIQLLAQIMSTFPDRDDPRRSAVLDAVGQLRGRQKQDYDEALGRYAEESRK